jgi:hypothetical protein
VTALQRCRAKGSFRPQRRAECLPVFGADRARVDVPKFIEEDTRPALGTLFGSEQFERVSAVTEELLDTVGRTFGRLKGGLGDSVVWWTRFRLRQQPSSARPLRPWN